MVEFDVFLSYASADLGEAEALERWLQMPPRNRTVWRDRRGILPGAPDFYPPILEGISASAAFLLLLSERWLRSSVAARELSDAKAAGKKVIPVIHPSIPRDPSTPEGRERKAELTHALQVSGLATVLERINWIWPVTDDSSAPDYSPVDQALVTDFAWAARHAIIVQRFNRWKAVKDNAALLRGADLVQLMADAFVNAPGREPVLTDEQRDFLLESQRYEALERERVEGLYWQAQARAAAFAARERAEAEPDVALLLAAEGAAVATVPEARGILLSLLHQHAALTGAIHTHGSARMISGVAFSADGRWLASIDRRWAGGDDRPAYLLVHDAATGKEWRRVRSQEGLSAVAWGKEWLAVASAGNIGWLRWDNWKEKFLGNTPTTLVDNVNPDYLAFSPPNLNLPQGEILAWGTQWGDIGLIRTCDHVRWQGRLGDDRSGNALKGLGWLNDGSLITAELGRLLVRPFPELQPVREISALAQIFSLACDGERWLVACVRKDSVGLLLGKGMEEEAFLPMTSNDIGRIVAWAGPNSDPWIVTGSTARRSGVPAVTLWKNQLVRQTLLQGEDEPISKVAADTSGRFVAAGDTAGRVWLWDRDRWSHLVTPALPELAIRCIASSPASIAIATHEGQIQFFGANLDGEAVGKMPGPFLPTSLLFCDQGRILLAISENQQIATMSTDGTVQILPWPAELPKPKRFAAAVDAPIVAAVCADNSIAIFRLTQSLLSLVRTITPGKLVIELALDPSGQSVYAAVERVGLEVVVWQADAPDQDPMTVAKIKWGMPPVPIAFSRGECVALGDNMDVLFVSFDSAESVARRGGHDEPVRCIVAGAGITASLATTFQDTRVDQIRLWTGDGQPLGPVTLPEHAVDMVISPDGSSIFVLGQSAKLWRVNLRAQAWTEKARQIAGRDLTAEEQRRYGIDAWQARVPK